MTPGYRQDELDAAGIMPEQIACIYGELRHRERLRREWKWSLRGHFFAMTSCKTGQRYKAHHRRAFADGDMTCLPSFDVLAQEIASHYPELSGDDCCQRLFDLISERVDRLPPAEDTYRNAIDTILDDATVGVCERHSTNEPF